MSADKESGKPLEEWSANCRPMAHTVPKLGIYMPDIFSKCATKFQLSECFKLRKTQNYHVKL